MVGGYHVLLAIILFCVGVGGRQSARGAPDPIAKSRHDLLRKMRERYFVQLKSTNRNRWATNRARRRAADGEGPLSPEPWPKETIYVVPDLHGDFLITVALLNSLGIMDENGLWTGGTNSRLIQLGDIADRGPDSPAIFELFWYLREQVKRLRSSSSSSASSSSSSAKIVQLLGNHEIMNLMNATSYVSSKEVLSYYVPEKKQNDGNMMMKSVDDHHHFSAGEMIESVWNPNLGYLGSRILASFDVIYRLGDVVFVHGGLTKKFSGRHELKLAHEVTHSIKHYANGDNRLAIKHYDLLEGRESPFWTRLISTQSEDPHACARLKQSRQAGGDYNIQIVGHTITESNRVETRCNNHYLMTDTGSSRWLYGMPSAIRIRVAPQLTRLGKHLYTAKRFWEELVIENSSEVINKDIESYYETLFVDSVCYSDIEGKHQIFNCNFDPDKKKTLSDFNYDDELRR